MICVDIPVDHPAFSGHFPGNPILPGVCILNYVAAAFEKPNEGFRSAKFLKPVRPGETLQIRFGNIRRGAHSFMVKVADSVVCEGQIISVTDHD